MIAAGLPQLFGQTGSAKSYAERLFEFVHIDRLNDNDACKALTGPAENEGVTVQPRCNLAYPSPYRRISILSSGMGQAQLRGRRLIPH